MEQPRTSLSDDLEGSLVAAGAPAWYLQAVSHATTSRRVDVGRGLRMNCVFWNDFDVGKPALLLVHGYRANARAWHAVAPFLTDLFRVIAVDLMGMGDSDSRAEYGDPGTFAEDLGVVIDELGLAPVTLIGHSFGGSCTIRLAHRSPASVSHLIVIDTTVLFPECDKERLGQPVGKPPPYPDRNSIVARYRLLPSQPCPQWTLTYMAHCSVREVEDGWRWCFDPELPSPHLTFETAAALRACAVPVDYIYAQHSRNSNPRRLRLIEDAIQPDGRVVGVAEAHHHVMLDQPQALVRTLRSLLMAVL